jgi:hypothetical protein
MNVITIIVKEDVEKWKQIMFGTSYRRFVTEEANMVL